MRLLAASLLGLSMISHAVGQSSATSAVEARQREVVQLGQQIYRIDLGNPGWTHQVVPICPAFKHHVFARYDRTSNGKQESYLAVFPLDVAGPPPKDKPWRGGILLLTLQSGDKPIAERETTVVAFNRVWSYELAHSGRPRAFPELGWPGLASCYARFAGQVPKSANTDSAPEDQIDLNNLPVSNLTLPLQDSSNRERFMNMDFEPNGLVKAATVQESPVAEPTK